VEVVRFLKHRLL